MDTALIFESCCDPLAVVVGEAVHEQNAAWRAAVGSVSSLADGFAAEDLAGLREALREARSGRASFVARLAVGPKAGAAMRCTLWSAGGEACCLRIDGAAPIESDIFWSQERVLQWLFERIDAIIWKIQADGTIVLSRGSGLSHYGMSPGQMEGVNAFQSYPQDSHIAKSLQQIFAGKQVRDGVAEHNVYWLQHGYPLRGAGGEVTAALGLLIGMTENIQELNNAQNLLRIVNELPMVVWAMTKDGTCTLSAGKSLSAFGFSPGELVGKNMFELYGDNAVTREEFRRVLGGEEIRSYQTIDGVVWSSIYRCARDADGSVTGLFAVSEDVSERVRNEERILAQLALIQAQKQAIDRLVSPIIEVWRGVLVVPLFGDVGDDRAALVTERLLDGVVEHAARFAILDLTGLEVVDTSLAQRLFNIMRGVDLLGCTPLISGIQPRLALALVELGVSIPAGRTYSTLADALQRCVSAPPAPRG